MRRVGGVFLHHSYRQKFLHAWQRNKQTKSCIFCLAQICGLSQSFIVFYSLFHSSINCRKLIINASDSCPYTFQLAVWNAIDFCPGDRSTLHIFVNSIQYSLFAYISMVP